MEMAVQYNDGYHEQRPDCKLRFEQIVQKQIDHDKEFRAHREFREATGTDIATLATKMDAQANSITELSKSVAGTNKVLLGLGTSALLMLLGFFVWYIQTMPR